MARSVFLLFSGIFLFVFPTKAEELSPDWERLSPEVEYASIKENNPRPQWFHALRIRRNAGNLQIVSVLGNRRVFGLSTIPDMLKTRNLPVPGTPAAAVNGDFFTIREDTNYTGTLRGIQISEGELVSSPEKKVAYPWTGGSVTFYASDLKHLGFAEVQPELTAELPDGRKVSFGINGMIRPGGAMLFTPRLALAPGEEAHPVYRMSTRTVDQAELILVPLDEPSPGEPYIRAGVSRRLRIAEIREQGNSPILPGRYVLSLPRGTALPAIGEEIRLCLHTKPGLAGVRTAISGRARLIADGKILKAGGRRTYAPRTVIGYDDNYLYFIVADGRMPELAVGVDFDELAEVAFRFGARDAVDFDGGGSSMIWAAGSIRNHLYTLPEIRRLGNALLILRGGENGGTNKSSP